MISSFFAFADRLPEKRTVWNILFWAILVITAFWRFLNLDSQSFWLDEIYTAQDVSGPLDFHRVFRLSSIEHQHHPPFYFLLLHGFLHLTHLGGEAGMRSLSLIFSLLTIPVVLRIGRKTEHPLLALGFLALYHSTLICLWFSLEARSYTLSFLLTALLLERFVSLENPAPSRSWILPGLISVVFLYTSYFGLFIVPAGYAGYLFCDGKWNRKRFLQVLVNGFILGLLYLPLALLVMGQTNSSASMEYIPKPGLQIFREGWVYFFRGGSLEYYAFALLLVAGAFLLRRYGKLGLLPLYLILQIAFFVAGSFVFSLVMMPILHHKYLVYAYFSLVFLVCTHLYLLLPRWVFALVVFLLSMRNLGSTAYFGLPEIYKSPYRQYLGNLASTRSDLPVVTNVGEFAYWYNQTHNLGLSLVSNRLRGDSATQMLGQGFWEFHMHGPFRFFPDSVPHLQDSLVCLGTARFDVLSAISLYLPRASCSPVALPEIARAAQIPAPDLSLPARQTGSHVVFTARSRKEWTKETLFVSIRGRVTELQIGSLETFYRLPVPGIGDLTEGEIKVSSPNPDQIRLGAWFQMK
jgi:hypothetical protein